MEAGIKSWREWKEKRQKDCAWKDNEVRKKAKNSFLNYDCDLALLFLDREIFQDCFGQ